jgi:hypothetical protein
VPLEKRMETTDIVYLGRDATRFALVQAAADLGVAFDTDAVELLVNESGGYSYLMQVLGYESGTRPGEAVASTESTPPTAASHPGNVWPGYSRPAGIASATSSNATWPPSRNWDPAQYRYRRSQRPSTGQLSTAVDHPGGSYRRPPSVDQAPIRTRRAHGGRLRPMGAVTKRDHPWASRSHHRGEPEVGGTGVSRVTDERPSSPKLRSSYAQ